VIERRPSRHLGPGELVVLVVAGLLLVHQVDHVLRADVSGWPFTGEVTWFTASLVLFPALVAGILLLRGRTWARVALAAALLVAVQGPHMFWETPADQYGTWPARPAGGAGPVWRRRRPCSCSSWGWTWPTGGRGRRPTGPDWPARSPGRRATSWTGGGSRPGRSRPARRRSGSGGRPAPTTSRR
jgi:hypothetical protein